VEVYLGLNPESEERKIMKIFTGSLKTVLPAILILCLSELPAKSIVDTCGIKIIENALKTSQIRADESAHFRSFRELMVEADKPCSTIVKALEKRISSLSDTTTFAIDTSGLFFVGDSSAPVQMVMYISLSCPICKKVYNELYDSVTTGSLSGKAKLAVKPFGVNLLNGALVAASHWGKQSELLRAVYPIKERLNVEMVIEVAESLKIPVESFIYRMENQSTTEYLRKSHQEALQNGVQLSPTLFINFRHYKSYNDSRWVSEAVEMIYRRISEKR